MRKIFTYILNSKVIVTALASIVLLSACKRADDEVNVSFIEAKLTSESSQQWSAPIHLDDDVCSGSVVLSLYSDRSFNYQNTLGGCSYSGYWSVEYNANRSGQFLKLYLDYGSGFQSFDMKYSSEQDIFYSVQHGDQSLQPFVKTVYNP